MAKIQSNSTIFTGQMANTARIFWEVKKLVKTAMMLKIPFMRNNWDRQWQLQYLKIKLDLILYIFSWKNGRILFFALWHWWIRVWRHQHISAFFLTIKRGEKIQNSFVHPLLKNVAVFFSRLKNIWQCPSQAFDG